jgi:osmoprotectant transport system permease protein
LISVPIGILVANNPVLAFVAANTSGLARAIPTLAFLAAVIGFLGIGFVPSITALTLLGIPPILLNTIAGLRGIDPAAIEAGRGVGMTRWQILTRIQMPITLPVLAAGVRTAAVQIVATAPLAALVGGGGYGDYILLGLNLRQTVPLLIGAGCVIVLALVVEGGLAGAQRLLTPAGLRDSVVAPSPQENVPARAEGRSLAA